MISLRPYQQDATTNIREAFLAGARRVLFTLPTGGGKTVIFSWICQQTAAKGGRICILVHRDELLGQVSRSLASFGVPHGIIAAGYVPTTDAVQVASVFTLARRLKSKPEFYKWYDFNLIIADEAHHVVAGSWDVVLKEFPQAHVLGVTATPARLDGKGLARSFDVLVSGPTVQELTDDGHLMPATIYAPPGMGVDFSRLKTRMGDFDRAELAKMFEKPTVYGCAVSHYKKYAAGVPAVAFCVSVKHAEETAAKFREAGVNAASIDGGLDSTERRRRVAQLTEGEIDVLTSCDLISEGFDCPAIGAAILLRPTKSLALYLQQVGRALRPYPGKSEAIILDHAGNVLRHGLPAQDREWKLTEDRATGEQGEKKIPLRTCMNCYAIVRVVRGQDKCPKCEHPWPVAERALLEQVDGELVKMTRREQEQAAREQSRRAALAAAKSLSPEARGRMVDGAKNLTEMQRVARMLGESSGWAWQMWQQKTQMARRAVMGTAAPAVQVQQAAQKYDPVTAEAF